jgi:hypothetical protein
MVSLVVTMPAELLAGLRQLNKPTDYEGELRGSQEERRRRQRSREALAMARWAT